MSIIALLVMKSNSKVDAKTLRFDCPLLRRPLHHTVSVCQPHFGASDLSPEEAITSNLWLAGAVVGLPLRLEDGEVVQRPPSGGHGTVGAITLMMMTRSS